MKPYRRLSRFRFTLLEVLTALVILALGSAGLLYQLATASNRARLDDDTWDQAHELTQAAEHLLLNGPDDGLDPTLFSGRYPIRYEYRDPSLPEPCRTVAVQGKRLRTLVITLETEQGETRSLEVDCWEEKK